MGLSLDIGANTRAAVRGMKDIEDSIDKTADALDDMARDGDRAGDKLERTFRGIVNDAKKADKAVENIGDKGKAGFGKAGEAASEFKDEALSNLSEVTSSFDGSMSSIQDLVQGTFGGLAASIPGIGLLAAGAAVGVGLIGAAIEGNDEAAQASRQRAADWAQAYTDAGSTIIGTATTVAGVLAIQSDPERYKQATDNAKNWGVEVSTAMRAMAGDAAALTVAQDGVNRKAEEYAAYESKVTEAALTTRLEWENGKNALDQLNGEMEVGATMARNTSEALMQLVAGASSATVEVDELGNKLYTLPDNTQVVVDAVTGLASQNIDRFKGDVDGVPQKVTTRVEVEVDDSAWRNWKPGDKVGRVRTASGPGGSGGTKWF